MGFVDHLHWCEVREWVDRSPLFGVEKKHVGSEETVRDRVLSLGEIAELRDAIPNARLENHAGLAIWILLATLARVGELSAAAWSDVDLEAGTWFIPETKNSRPHIIYLSGFAIAQFRQLREVIDCDSCESWLLALHRLRHVVDV